MTNIESKSAIVDRMRLELSIYVENWASGAICGLIQNLSEKALRLASDEDIEEVYKYFLKN